MPLQQILPTWAALNNMNTPYPSGMGDPVSGQTYYSGGLNVGDYFDVTNDEALNASYLTNGICFAGRYRFVQVDSGATAANVKTGTVGYVRAGSTLKSVVTTNVGSGGTAGAYTIQATAGTGGGSGASISVTVGSGGTVTAVSVVNPGYGYVSAPTFNLNTATTGLSSATVQAELGIGMNIVTSADIAFGGNAAQAGVGPVRPVVFLNAITPGQYGFIQELGTATVLSGSGKSGTIGQNALVDSGAANGTLNSSATTYSVYNIGKLVDTQTSSNLFKIVIDSVPVVQD